MTADFGLEGRTALVTGASSGIGRRQAWALAKAGAAVVLLGRRQAQLQEAVDEIREAGGSAAPLPADLSDRTGIPDTAARASTLFGTIDILINAAGINLRQAPDQITWESWDQTLDLNLAVPFFLARELQPGMTARGRGRIINLASLQSTRAFANGLAYGASKGGVAQLTRAMAEAWSGQAVTCNAIAPGFFPTGLTGPVFRNAELTTALADRTAIGRNGELSDLDGLTVFLASSAADYITGQVIHLDGGFTAK